MVGDTLVEIDAKEPAVCDVDSDLLLKTALGIYAVDISDQQHFYHYDWVDGRSAGIGIEISNLIVNEIKINKPIKVAQKMLLRHKALKGHKRHFHLLAFGLFEHGNYLPFLILLYHILRRLSRSLSTGPKQGVTYWIPKRY